MYVKIDSSTVIFSDEFKATLDEHDVLVRCWVIQGKFNHHKSEVNKSGWSDVLGWCRKQ